MTKDFECGCGCEENCKEKSDQNVIPSIVDRLFGDAEEEVRKEQLESYKRMIKNKLKQKDAAELILKNINTELAELRFKINQELGNA